jgi:hypothetical protein
MADEPAIQLPSEDLLGIQVRQEYRATITTDLRSGTQTRATFSPLGRLDSVLITTPSGRLLRRQEVRDHEWIDETFAPEHIITRTGPHPRLHGIDVIERTTFRAGKPEQYVNFLKHVESASETCAALPTPAAWENTLNDLSWLDSEPKDVVSGDSTVDIGGATTNLYAHGCRTYPGGTIGLARDFKAALTSAYPAWHPWAKSEGKMRPA